MKTKKKSLNQKRNLFSPNSNGDQRLDAHQSQIIGGDANVDHTQIIGGDTVKLLVLGGCINKVKHPITKFLCSGTIFLRGAAILAAK